MRVFVLFDLPVQTSADRRVYAAFRKYLLGAGFMMLQESVYCKLTLNATAAAAVRGGVRGHAPGRGLVQLLTVTEKQFSGMEFITGESDGEVICSVERLVVL